MNSKQKATLKQIFADPVQSNIGWKAIESLLDSLGATKTEGNGSRVRFHLNGARASFHRPHEPDTDKGAVKSMRRFLITAGIEP